MDKNSDSRSTRWDGSLAEWIGGGGADQRSTPRRSDRSSDHHDQEPPEGEPAKRTRFSEGEEIGLVTSDGRQVGTAVVIGVSPDAADPGTEIAVLRLVAIDSGLERVLPPSWGLRQPRP